jgi:hypothetical protein
LVVPRTTLDYFGPTTVCPVVPPSSHALPGPPHQEIPTTGCHASGGGPIPYTMGVPAPRGGVSLQTVTTIGANPPDSQKTPADNPDTTASSCQTPRRVNIWRRLGAPATLHPAAVANIIVRQPVRTAASSRPHHDRCPTFSGYGATARITSRRTRGSVTSDLHRHPLPKERTFWNIRGHRQPCCYFCWYQAPRRAEICWKQAQRRGWDYPRSARVLRSASLLLRRLGGWFPNTRCARIRGAVKPRAPGRKGCRPASPPDPPHPASLEMGGIRRRGWDSKLVFALFQKLPIAFTPCFVGFGVSLDSD